MTALTTNPHDRDPLTAAVFAALRRLPVQRGAGAVGTRLAALDEPTGGQTPVTELAGTPPGAQPLGR
ncbi:hypothetical protein [Geodermatophilus sp. SYSU D00698]